jgi:hypothetical protein
MMSLSLLADEHIPAVLVEQIRKTGIDIVSVRELEIKGAPDRKILQTATKQGRAVLTLDKDFISALEQEYDHNGIIKFKKRYNIGDMLHDIQRVNATLTPDELENTIIYLPWES